MPRAALIAPGRRAHDQRRPKPIATRERYYCRELREVGNARRAGGAKFVLGGDRYDQREKQEAQHIQSLIDMRNYSSPTSRSYAQALLAEYKSKGAAPKSASDADLWEAQRVVGAVIHGPTGETMPLIGRMRMFVPVNVPIAARASSCRRASPPPSSGSGSTRRTTW